MHRCDKWCLCLTSTLCVHPPIPCPAAHSISSGALLCQGLFLQRNQLANWFAAVAFAHVLNNNREAKVCVSEHSPTMCTASLVLADVHRSQHTFLGALPARGHHSRDRQTARVVACSVHEDAEPKRWGGCLWVRRRFHRHSRLIFHAPTLAPQNEPRQRAAYLILICTWLCDCPFAVKTFLQIPEAISTILAQVGRGGRGEGGETPQAEFAPSGRLAF